MRLDDFDPSDNVRDLGSSSGPGGGGFGGGGNILLGLLPLLLGRKLGCGTIAILAIGAVLFFSMGGGGGLIAPQSGVQAPAGSGGGATGAAACNTPERRFSCQVLASTEQTWERIFAESGQRYPAPTLNFYQGGATSGCGFASSAVGPYYCPADQGVFLDTSFFDELATRFGAAGDFAQAYVIAHEVGHHIQTVTGTSERVRREQARVGEREGNQLSVRMELQADCYAGVWANRNRQYLEAGDIEEGLRAAEAIGDDTLQRQAQGRIVPDSFTHGSSAQRQKWLRIGLDSGNPAACDTFSQAI